MTTLSGLFQEDFPAAAQALREGADARQVGGTHYKAFAVQPWTAMEAWMTRQEFCGFLRGNALKYLARAGSKGSALEDVRKARHYLEKLEEVLSREEPAP